MTEQATTTEQTVKAPRNRYSAMTLQELIDTIKAGNIKGVQLAMYAASKAFDEVKKAGKSSPLNRLKYALLCFETEQLAAETAAYKALYEADQVAEAVLAKATLPTEADIVAAKAAFEKASARLAKLTAQVAVTPTVVSETVPVELDPVDPAFPAETEAVTAAPI